MSVCGTTPVNKTLDWLIHSQGVVLYGSGGGRPDHCLNTGLLIRGLEVGDLTTV